MTPECQRKLAEELYKTRVAPPKVNALAFLAERSEFWRAVQRRYWRAGLLFRAGSCWIGLHWSPSNRHLCINLLPFITIWICPPGGVSPC